MHEASTAACAGTTAELLMVFWGTLGSKKKKRNVPLDGDHKNRLMYGRFLMFTCTCARSCDAQERIHMHLWLEEKDVIYDGSGHPLV